MEWMLSFCYLALFLQWCTSALPQWCPGECSCFNAFTSMDCSRADLTFIPLLPNTTTHLYMENNRMHHLHAFAFQDIPKVIVINLQSNQLVTVDASAFAGLYRLQDLNLSHNKIKLFTVSFLINVTLHNLRDLDLSGNKLWTIPRNLSYFAPEIEVLNLSYNQIASGWLDSSYASLSYLHNLDLTGNPIHTLASFHLKPLHRLPLESLRLADCALMHIDSDTFTGMNNLTSLTLAHNKINQSMLTEALSGFGNSCALITLDLSSMGLTEITGAMVKSFPQLEILILANNSLEFIEPEVFSILQYLHTLEAQGNKFVEIEMISSLLNIRRLNLQRNNIDSITLAGLVHLELLDLSFNDIQTVPMRWLSQTDALKVVNLSHNKIQRISQHGFHKISLEHLNLSHNHLTVLHNMGLQKISTLILCYNEINSLTASAFDHIEESLEDLDLSHNQLSHLPQNTFYVFGALQRLNLANNNLGLAFQLGVHASLFQTLSHLQVLDLSLNNISTLPEDQFNSLHHLTTLYLHDNKIQDLTGLSLGLMPSLAKLDVSHNNICSVDTQVLTGLYYLETIDLTGNTFHCTCSLVHFLHWLNTTVVLVKGLHDHNKYTCAFPEMYQGKSILTYRPSTAECLHPAHDIAWDLTIFAITAASVTGVTLLTALTIYYGRICNQLKSLHYRWQIRYREVSGIEIGDPKG